MDVFSQRNKLKGFSSFVVILVVALILVLVTFYVSNIATTVDEELRSNQNLQKNSNKQTISNDGYEIYMSDFGCNFSVEISNQWIKEGGGDINKFVRFRFDSGDIRSDFVQIHCSEGITEFPNSQDHIPSDKVDIMKIVGEKEYTKSDMNFKQYFIEEEGSLYSFWTYIQPVEQPNYYVIIYTNVPNNAEPDPNKIEEFENYNRVVNSLRFN